VFDAYNIVSPGDLQDAARKMAGKLPVVTETVTVATRRGNPVDLVVGGAGIEPATSAL
jgi:hypothetical protein